jgi:hypothetical protein
MKIKKMDVLLGLSYGFGLLLIGAAATVYWGNGSKVLALWIFIVGVIGIVLTAGVQAHRAISAANRHEAGDGPPKIRVKGATILTPNGGRIWEPVDILYGIENSGRSTAHVIQRNWAVHLREPGLPPKGAPAFDAETEDKTKIDVPAGKAISGQFISKLSLTWEQQVSVRTGQQTLLFNGYVRYTDDAGIETWVFFLQRWDHATERFFTVEDPDYERPDPH